MKGLGLSPVRLYKLFPDVLEVLSQVLAWGGFSYGFVVFDFSHDEVKQAVVIGLIGFFLFIASAS